MCVEKIRRIRMTVRTQGLMLIDELRWLVVFEVTNCAAGIAENGVRRCRDMSRNGVTFQARDIRHTLKRVDMAGAAFSTRCRMCIVDWTGLQHAWANQIKRWQDHRREQHQRNDRPGESSLAPSSNAARRGTPVADEMLATRCITEFKCKCELGTALRLDDTQDIRPNLDHIADNKACFAL